MWLNVSWVVWPDRAVNLKQCVPPAKLSIIQKVAQILDIIHVILVPYLFCVYQNTQKALASIYERCNLQTIYKYMLSPTLTHPARSPSHFINNAYVQGFNGDAVAFALSSWIINLHLQCHKVLYAIVIDPQIHKHAKYFTCSPVAVLEILLPYSHTHSFSL